MANAGPLARMTVLFAAVLLLQVSVASQITFAGVVVDLFALTAIVAGLHGGAERGVLVGFAAGLITDLLVHTPFGLVAMVTTLLGYAAGNLATQISQLGLILRALVAGGLAGCAVFFFVVLGWLLDLNYVVESDFLTIAIVNTLAGAALNPASERVLRWALAVQPRLAEAR